ncbi:hypothetical protein C3747_135g9 [Trypanosoma cruzi]|uniref:Uncharacterized protein n=2 Tax=Trypanosoma cruzi TaxID=5693 RepID=Q4D4F4_TRYCC|nr:hypothetical protein, conserved [Trypanosoma cruzi]EAN87407.1 hypothetical protein, conserved [Trypanosoma cruzi]PWV05243.1 hypothetical protein C3747_135g9 [Trypanosoma cruzi]RNC57313.1 hypothetical protein TcCL_ESM05074 [Trypanosoma cruzi]|eukprot:XP_809258.1 hypothetical protein [Trypanosoma cruzi strain CL Brener]
MTDCQNEAAYYPTVDPAQMGPNSDLIAAIPYLCEFRLSTPHVIYKPPTVLDFRAAGAIPLEHMSESHNKLPTITLSAEIAPYRSNFREFLATATSKFLCPPEREGAEAISEELQCGGHETSDQEYWSEEYWKLLQTEELDSAGSMATDSGFQSLGGANPRSTNLASTTSPSRRRRGIARRKCDFSNASHRRGERENLHGICPSQRSACEDVCPVPSRVRRHPPSGPSSRAGAGTSRDCEGSLGPYDDSSLIQPPKKAGVTTNVGPKTKRPRKAAGRVLNSLSAKGRHGKGKNSVGTEDAFAVHPPGIHEDSLLLNASGTGDLDMSISSLREGAGSGGLNIKTKTTGSSSDAHKAGVSFSGGEVPISFPPVKFAPIVQKVFTAPNISPAAHGARDAQTDTLVSAPSSSNIHHRDDNGGSGGGGVRNSNKKAKKKISTTSVNETTVSRHNSGAFFPVEAPHVERSQVLSFSQRKDVAPAGPSVGGDASAEGPVHPNPLLGVGKQTPLKCCTLM